MSSESNIGHIIFNQMSENKYSSLIPTEGEFYVTPDYIDLPILTSMWFDHIVNDISWLRSDTFSWQAGDVYTAVYNHLVNDISGKTAVSENVGGVTISYYLADDGHKITTDETSVANIYTATGVAWYYILDTTNHRFKLPRTKFGFTGLRNNVGNYVAPGLPNITGGSSGWLLNGGGREANGVFAGNRYITDSVSGLVAKPNWNITGGGGEAYRDLNFNASYSNSIYGNSNTVQPPATQMYLYFYVGNFNQDSIIQTAGLNAELFNGKADINVTNALQTSKLNKDLSNLPSNIKYVKETWKSGTSWYRIWSDGWIEQGGYLSWNGAWTTLTFNRPFTTTNYYINGGGYRSDSSPYQCMIDFKDWGTSSCSVWSSDDTTSNPCVMKWYACGY